MNNNVVYIVGDTFNTFSKLENVFTVSEVLHTINNVESLFLRQAICVLGQGVSKKEREQLEQYSRNNKIGFIVNANQLPASNQLTHKHKTENIMVTEPMTVISNKLYRAYLSTDDDCAEMSDHITGQHIQGMVLTEAARQMMLAVAEKYVLKPEEKNNLYCVLNSVKSHFYKFAFPVDIKVEHEVFNLKQNRPGNYQAETKTSFIQNDVIITQVEIDYKFYAKEFLLKMEAQLAEQALKFNVEQHSNNSYLDMAA